MKLSPTLYALISQLADGQFHSGRTLGALLGISRAAVWKQLKNCEAMGLEIHAVSGKGYRLVSPLQLLQRETILALLSLPNRSRLHQLQIHHTIDSTNRYLFDAAADGMPSGVVCLAEQQERGRGRRGRSWVSPFASNIYLSVLWRFSEGTSKLSGLSLAAGVALMRAFHRLNIAGVGLKWPNDVVTSRGKLAGILIEVAGESNGPCHAVIGAGINYAMPKAVAPLIDQPWDDIQNLAMDLDRNTVAAVVIDELLSMFERYEKYGLEAFQDEWARWDILRGCEVTVYLPNMLVHGVANGIDARGLLLVQHDGVESAYSSGEVSIRRALR